MTQVRTIEQVVLGVPGEYYAILNASAAGDQLLMAFEGGGTISDISIESVGTTNVDWNLYLHYPASSMRNILDTGVSGAGKKWSLNAADSQGKMWYRVPNGTILQLFINSTPTVAGPVDILAIVR